MDTVMSTCTSMSPMPSLGEVVRDIKALGWNMHIDSMCRKCPLLPYSPQIYSLKTTPL